MKLTLSEYIKEAISRRQSKMERALLPREIEYMTQIYTQLWARAVRNAAAEGRLPDAVLADYVRLCGVNAFCSEFRGVSEQEGFQPLGSVMKGG